MRKNQKIFQILLSSFQSTPLQDFIDRVEADGGIFESQTTLDNIISELSGFYDDASFLLTPNGYKTSKLYATKPTDGSGDLTFSRNTTEGTRKIGSRVETKALNIPRFDYNGGSYSSILLEPQRTNLLLRSDDFANASWTKTNVTVPGTGTTYAEPNGIWVDGNYVYVANYLGNNMSILDKSNPNDLVLVSTFTHASLSGPIGVQVDGNYAYLSSNLGNSILSVDISDVANPTFASSVAVTTPWNFHKVGNYIYVSQTGGLRIVDATNPTSLSLSGSVGSLGTCTDAQYDGGNYVGVCGFTNNTFYIIDVSNPASPSTAGSIAHGSGGAQLTACHGVQLRSNKAYVLARTSGALNIFDYTNPASITVDSVTTTGGSILLTGCENAQLSWPYLHVCNYTGNSYQILDVTNSASPSAVGNISNASGGANLYGANRVSLSGNYAYVASRFGNAVEVLDISTLATPAHTSKFTGFPYTFKLLETAVTNVHQITQSITKAGSSLSYIFSCFAKKAERDYLRLTVGQGPDALRVYYNLNTGSIGSQVTVGTGYTLLATDMLSIGDGWYRCAMRFTTNSSTSLGTFIAVQTADAELSYLGNTSSGIYAGGASLIQSTSPIRNSYVQTFGATVTREADIVTPLTSFSSYIGQSTGTMFLHVNNVSADSTSKAISISDGTANNRITIDFTTGNAINVTVITGGVSQASITNGGFSNLTEYKVAVTYQNNKVALFVNGSKIGEDLSVTVPACSRFGFDSGAGSNPFYGLIRTYGHAATAYSDADSQTLTTI